MEKLSWKMKWKSEARREPKRNACCICHLVHPGAVN
ncbi:unnamed protein product [Rhodiola kirilowii]